MAKKVVLLAVFFIVSSTLRAEEALYPSSNKINYELWTTSNDECGPNCDKSINFVTSFGRKAQKLEKKGYTKFTPHYMTWYCPKAYIGSKQCNLQCINNGRYCAPDPEQDFSIGYNGKDVVVQNLRQACFYKVANELGESWLWWDYVTAFTQICTMKSKNYNVHCSNSIIAFFGIDLKKVDECVGNVEADVENPVMKAEQDAMAGRNITVTPTLIINNILYKGELRKKPVLKAICSHIKGKGRAYQRACCP